jgi:hypothetical protein
VTAAEFAGEVLAEQATTDGARLARLAALVEQIPVDVDVFVGPTVEMVRESLASDHVAVFIGVRRGDGVRRDVP